MADYLIEFSNSNGLFKELGERETYICSTEQLIELLQKRSKGVVWNAHWIDKKEYLLNHPDEHIKTI